MKLKTPLLAILLLPLLTLNSYSQMPAELPDSQSNDYGIVLERFYPGTLVLELLLAAETEIDTAVTEAFAEGYKAASLRYAPELASLRITESALRLELDAERRKHRRFWPAVGVSAGVSFLAGFFLHSAAAR